MRLIVTALLLAGLCGCDAPRAGAQPAHDTLAIAREHGIHVVDPLELDARAERDVLDAVRLEGTPLERARRLVRWLDDGRAEFRYARETKTARDAYASRSGDCFSVTNMFVAFARHVGIDARFAYVREVTHTLDDETYFASSHLAAAVVEGSRAEVVDFERRAPDRMLASYRIIPDAEAVALFNSNLAMADSSPEGLARAERLLRFFLEAAPPLPELENNLAVVLLRRGRTREAMSVLQDASVRHPAYGPVFANGLVAAMRLGDDAAASHFARAGQAAARRDPVFAFAQGVRLFRAGRFAQARDYFEQAQDRGRKSPLVWTYVVRADMAMGEVDDAAKAFSRAWQDHPGHARLVRLRQEFPALAVEGPR